MLRFNGHSYLLRDSVFPIIYWIILIYSAVKYFVTVLNFNEIILKVYFFARCVIYSYIISVKNVNLLHYNTEFHWNNFGILILLCERYFRIIIILLYFIGKYQ